MPPASACSWPNPVLRHKASKYKSSQTLWALRNCSSPRDESPKAPPSSEALCARGGCNRFPKMSSISSNPLTHILPQSGRLTRQSTLTNPAPAYEGLPTPREHTQNLSSHSSGGMNPSNSVNNSAVQLLTLPQRRGQHPHDPSGIQELETRPWPPVGKAHTLPSLRASAHMPPPVGST